MKLIDFSFKNFRNLQDGNITFNEGLNIIYGDNAQGKTNLIEAIWLFTGGRSFRASKDFDLIQFDCKERKAKLTASFFSEERFQNAEIIIDPSKMHKRTLFLNSVAKSSIAEIVGKFCAVVFSPTHLSLIKEGPSSRRKFIDAAICQVRPLYIPALIEFNRVLNQRNALLRTLAKNKNSSYLQTLEVWNERFIRTAAKIILYRQNYCKKIEKYSSEIYVKISQEKEHMKLSYKRDLPSMGDIVTYLKEELNNSIDEDLNLGYTSKGPQRDDINIKINNKSARKFASQGQQRSAVLALKLAEAKILGDNMSENPIILLDDVMSELDPFRQEYLLKNIAEYQSFITCCDPSCCKIKENSSLFFVKNGCISSN